MRDRDERDERRGGSRIPYSERRLAPSPSPPPTYRGGGGYRERNNFRGNYPNRNDRYYRGRRSRPPPRNLPPTRVAAGPDLHANRGGNVGPDLHSRGAPPPDSYAYPPPQQEPFHPPSDQHFAGPPLPNERYPGPHHPSDRYSAQHPDRYGTPSQPDRFHAPPPDRYSGPPPPQQHIPSDRAPIDHHFGQPPPHLQLVRHAPERYGPPMHMSHNGPPPDRFGGPPPHTTPLAHSRPLPHGAPPMDRFASHAPQPPPSHVPSNLVPLPVSSTPIPRSVPMPAPAPIPAPAPTVGGPYPVRNNIQVRAPKPGNGGGPHAPDPPSPCPVPTTPLTGEFRPATPPVNNTAVPPPIESVQIPRRPPWQGQTQPMQQAPAIAPPPPRPTPFPPLRSKPAPRKMPPAVRAVVDLYIGGSQSAVLVERNGSVLFVGVTQVGAQQRVACVGMPACEVEMLVGPNDAASKALLSCSRRIAKALESEDLQNVLVSVAIEGNESEQYEEIAQSLEKLAAKKVLTAH